MRYFMDRDKEMGGRRDRGGDMDEEVMRTCVGSCESRAARAYLEARLR